MASRTASGPSPKRPPHIALADACPSPLIACLLPVLAGVLYLALATFANGQTLDGDTRAEIEALREGEMRKLNLHREARPAGTDPFTDREGVEHHLAESNGKVRLVNFWATWCAPCRVEKPALDALAAELTGPEFEVIAIATGRHDLEAIDRFNAEVGVTHLGTYLDTSNRLAMAMGVPGLPVTVLLNREGEEIGRLMGGADWDNDSARAIIERVIAIGR